MSLKTKPKTKTKAAENSSPEETEQKELRTILENLRQQTLRDISEKVKSGTAATGQEIGDIYDLASEERNRELDLLMGDRERNKLTMIDEAFTRLEEGTYGQCDECGEPINPKRLKALPFARTCVDCQTDKENEERILRDRDQDSNRVYSVMHGNEPPTSAFSEDEE